MKQLTLLVGPPGSGKSTHAKVRLGTDTSIVYINQDSQGKAGHLEIFNKTIESGKSIIVDRMNFDKHQRNKYLEPAKNNGYMTTIVVIHESHSECLYRCSKRLGHPTISTEQDALSALDIFFRYYERVSDDEADHVIRFWPKSTHKPKAIICDLDGTLCNIDHRLKWMKKDSPKKHWPEFFAGMKDDLVNPWCAGVLAAFQKQINIVLCSGRGNEYRPDTEYWLKKHAIEYKNLFMRLEKDFRRDDVVKEIILDFEILTRYEPYFFIDDRQQVVDMWRKHGFVCLQCAKGDF